MTEAESGYLHALSDVHHEVQQMVQDASTSSEGKLELLGVLSFLNEQIRSKAAGIRDHSREGAADEDAMEPDA